MDSEIAEVERGKAALRAEALELDPEGLGNPLEDAVPPSEAGEPKQLTEFMKTEIPRWAKVIKESGARAE